VCASSDDDNDSAANNKHNDRYANNDNNGSANNYDDSGPNNNDHRSANNDDNQRRTMWRRMYLDLDGFECNVSVQLLAAFGRYMRFGLRLPSANGCRHILRRTVKYRLLWYL
jgi:hypothetical protein